MKKVVSVVLVALMVLGLSVTAFAANGKITVAPDKTEAKAGDTVVLTVKGEGFDNAGALALSVVVDDKLELADAGKWLLAGGYVTAALDDKGNAVFAAESAVSINADLYQLSVKVKDGTAAGTYAVKVTVKTDADVVAEFTANITVPGTEAPHEHKYGEWKKVDDKNHEAVCECGDKKTEAHTWDAGKVTKVPTTEAEGEKTYTCTACGATKTEVLPKESIPTGDNAVAVVFLSTLALVAACGVVVASKKRVND